LDERHRGGLRARRAYHCGSRIGVVVLTGCVALVALPACGAAPRAVTQRYEAIQTHEAALERAIVRGQSLRDAMALEGETPERCGDLTTSLDAASAAADAVCDAASGTRDADAAVRCERARRRARDATAGWDRCGSGQTPPA
jgi:hypothetical protein